MSLWEIQYIRCNVCGCDFVFGWLSPCPGPRTKWTGDFLSKSVLLKLETWWTFFFACLNVFWGVLKLIWVFGYIGWFPKTKIFVFANQPTVHSVRVSRAMVCGFSCWRWWYVTGDRCHVTIFLLKFSFLSYYICL